MSVIEIREGQARLRLPEADRSTRGPESKETAAVFYNPAMAVNRDLGSLLLHTRAKSGWDALDGLSASGVRGLRYALEAEVPLRVHWNDWNPVAVRLIEENARLNGIAEPVVTRKNLNVLLHEMVWHVVELDPYGSPAPFLDAATRAVRDRGLLGVTATDTTGLAGVFPSVCKRRYLATPMHGELGHEVALRILAAATVRTAAKWEIAMRPILAHATDHYYRVSFDARRGATRVDENLKNVGTLRYCPACGDRGFGEERACPTCGGAVRTAGPLWTGPLTDATTADAMLARASAHPLAQRDDSLELLTQLAAEARAPPLYYDLHKTGSFLGLGSPPTQPVLDALRAAGYTTAPVHFNKLAVRTNAPVKEVMRIVREATDRVHVR